MSTATTTETATNTEVVRYRLVPEESTFTVQAFAEGLFSAFGHDPVIVIRDFKGEVQFVPGTFEAAALKMTINSKCARAKCRSKGQGPRGNRDYYAGSGA